LAGNILFLLTFCDVAQPFSVGGWKISSRVTNTFSFNYVYYEKLYKNTYSIIEKQYSWCINIRVDGGPRADASIIVEAAFGLRSLLAI
jgi:hypothetical protein